MAGPSVAIATSNISSDAAGFSRIAKLHDELAAFANTQVVLDFSRLNWLDGHLAASLHVVFRHARARGTSVKIEGLKKAVGETLQKNAFLQPPAKDRFNTTIPLTDFDLTGGVQFSLFAKTHLQRPEIPHMSKALQSKFYEGIDELFANSALHSNAKIPVTVCGQFFPRNSLIDFAIVDGGRGIPGAVRSTGRVFRSAAEAIAWAMEPGNTTRQGDIPGGLGSKILREFVALNKGRLIIASGTGYWCQKGSVVQKSLLSHPFPGTAVILEINTSDKNKYDLVKAPRPEDIW